MRQPKPAPQSTEPATRGPTLTHWLSLLLVSAGVSAIFMALHVPAATLLGCMLSAIWFSTRQTQLAVPRLFFGWGQGVLGCLMAQSLQPRHLGSVLMHWPEFLLATVSIIAASAALGWLLMRRQVMPGTTAVWGMAPGAASAMVIMAESYGADVRLVAFMQYTRVVLVTAVAALVARVWGAHVPLVLNEVVWWGSGPIDQLLATLGLVLGGAWLARRFDVPGGAMVLPLLAGAVLQGLGVMSLQLPPALLALAYAAIGWSVGLRFTRDILRHALRSLPKVLASILALMALGVLIAALLVQLTGLDPLSAYLATSPGGADSMAVIAATSMVETSFVMAMQLARFLMVLVIGPSVSRWVAKRGTPPA